MTQNKMTTWEDFEERRKGEIQENIAQQIRQENPQWFQGKQKLAVNISSEVVRGTVIQKVEANYEILPFEKDEFAKEILSKLTTRCLIGAETSVAENIKSALMSIKNLQQLQFDVVTDARYLLELVKTKPDIVLLSSQLPMQNPTEFFQRLTPATGKVILLVGPLEHPSTKDNIAIALQNGIRNIVTGNIPETPGDRPYTLPIALMYNRPDVFGDQEDPLFNLVKIQESSAIPLTFPKKEVILDAPVQQREKSISVEEKEQPHNPFPFLKETPPVPKPGRVEIPENQPEPNGLPGCSPKKLDIKLGRRKNKTSRTPTKQVEQSVKPQPEVIKAPKEEISTATKSTNSGFNNEQEVDNHTLDILNQLMAKPPEVKFTNDNRKGINGKLIIVSSSKGGVAKTTTALMITISLAKSGIPVLLLDANFGAPDCATFFKIKGVPGIEYLANKPFSPNRVDDVIYKVNDFLHVLPGPMDTTSPHFEKGKLSIIMDYLLSKYPIVVVDTPPEFWEDDRQKDIFQRADRVYSILTQSAFSQAEARDYAPKYIMFGVNPEKLGLILTMYDPELIHPKELEKSFNANLKIQDKKTKPRFEGIIPVNTREFYKGTHVGQVSDINQSYSQIHLIVKNIADLAGYVYDAPTSLNPDTKKKGGLLSKWIEKFKR